MARRLILDTTMLIAYERGTSGWTPDDDDDVAVAAISLAEFRVGVELSTSQRHVRERRRALSLILPAVSALAYTEKTAEHHARLVAHTRRAGTLRGPYDIIVAAHAAETGRTIVSLDAKARFGDLPGVTAISAE